MRRLIALSLCIVFVAAAGPAAAQDEEGWNVASDINLTLTQNAYSDNWDGEETGSISWALTANGLAERSFGESILNKHTLKLEFGQSHRQDPETNEWKRPETSTDVIDYETVVQFTLGWFVDPFVAGRVETHFLDNRYANETMSLNPVLFTESAGVARAVFRTDEREWTNRIGAAFRQHLDRNVPGDGDERETETTTDGGLQFVSELRTPMAEDRITLSSRLELYQALINSEEDEEGVGDEWKSLDVTLENTLAASITDHIKVNLSLDLLYDEQIDPDVRFRQTLALGLTFKVL
ncbi:MAG: hypothetical protein GF405_02405 [Candidatus Eisenbacteria bacterium]|nr:hypothetical protein [Candidatus Eisenbacteria bacterium]